MPGRDAAVGLAAGGHAGEGLLDLVEHDHAGGHGVDQPQRLADVRLALADERTQQAPTSRISVGRPVSAPRALQKADLPVPGTPSSSTPRGRTRGLRRGRSARVQKALSASRPPRSANVSPPRCSVSRPLFFSACAFSSQSTPGSSRPCRTSDRAKAFSASTRVSPAAASSTASGRRPRAARPARWRRRGRSPPAASRPGRSCSTTTNWLSSSTGICTDRRQDDDEGAVLLAGGDRRVERLDDLDRFRNRWKFRSTSSAVPSGVARAASARIAASGSAAPARGRRSAGCPATARPRSTSQVARVQPSRRHSPAISAIASSCS